MDDNKIVDLYLMRDESAIKQTAEKYGNTLRRIAYNVVGDIQTAEECENDTYLQVWKLIPPHEPRNYLLAFCARITRHIALDFCKEKHRQKRSALICELSQEMEQCIPSSFNTEDHLNSAALSSLIDKFIDSLDQEKRIIFVRRYWLMDSVSSISRDFGISQSKVKSILFRSRNQLREYLEKEGYNL